MDHDKCLCVHDTDMSVHAHTGCTAAQCWETAYLLSGDQCHQTASSSQTAPCLSCTAASWEESCCQCMWLWTGSDQASAHQTQLIDFIVLFPTATTEQTLTSNVEVCWPHFDKGSQPLFRFTSYSTFLTVFNIAKSISFSFLSYFYCHLALLQSAMSNIYQAHQILLFQDFELCLSKTKLNFFHKDRMWLPLWLDWKMVTYAKISQKMVNPRDKAGNAQEEEEEEKEIILQKNWEEHCDSELINSCLMLSHQKAQLPTPPPFPHLPPGEHDCPSS